MVYPDSDGQPIAENTEQYEWIVTLKGNLDACLPGAFVGGDLLWYPVEGDPLTRVAPDVLVALGRPKGRRGAYMQWVEGGVAPQVVFEVWSPGNTFGAQVEKLRFYERHGVEEFYTWDPDRRLFAAFVRDGAGLEPVAVTTSFTSPLLGVRFDVGQDLAVFRPDGTRFFTFDELDAERQRLARERDAVAQERDAVAQERDALRAQLRAAGIEAG